jgi:hypothetical protein
VARALHRGAHPPSGAGFGGLAETLFPSSLLKEKFAIAGARSPVRRGTSPSDWRTREGARTQRAGSALPGAVRLRRINRPYQIRVTCHAVALAQADPCDPWFLSERNLDFAQDDN